jgi:ParB-like chromosome segregation protein Spo0J
MKKILPKLASIIEISTELKMVQDFMPISNDDYQRLKASIAKDGLRDPVKGYHGADGRFMLLSGLNRLKACRELGIETVLTELVDISESERQDFAISENLDRRHFTSEQKQKVVELLLKNSPDKSNRLIGEMAGVSKDTVNSVRSKLEGRGEISHVDKRTDSKGRQQPARKPVKPPSNPSKSSQDERKTSKVNQTPGNEILTNIDIKTEIISWLDSLDNDGLNKVLDYIQKL